MPQARTYILETDIIEYSVLFSGSFSSVVVVFNMFAHNNECF